MTESIGMADQVRLEARQGAQFPPALASTAEQSPKLDPRIAAMIAQDTAEVGSGLSAIGESKTDGDFIAAVLAISDPARQAAEPRVAKILLLLAGRFQARPPGNPTREQQQGAVAYLTTFSNRLIALPAECEQASSGMPEPSGEEQAAEIKHQANLDRTLTAAVVMFAATAIAAGEVGSALATRPPVRNNYYYVNQSTCY